MIDISDLFKIENIFGSRLGSKKCPRPFADLARKSSLHGLEVDAVRDFERLWAHFIDDLRPALGPGAMMLVSGDWSNLDKNQLTNMLQVWKVWDRYRHDLGIAAKQINPLANGRGVDPRVSSAANAQLKGYNAFRSAISVTEEREKKGAFARFKDWFSGKTTNLKQSVDNFDLDEWSESGWGVAATTAVGAGYVAAMSATGDTEEYRDERQLPERERFRRWSKVVSKYPGATELDHVADKSTTRLGYGTVIGSVPDGRVVFKSAVSLWVVDPSDL